MHIQERVIASCSENLRHDDVTALRSVTRWGCYCAYHSMLLYELVLESILHNELVIYYSLVVYYVMDTPTRE